MIPAATLEYEPTPDGRLVALAPLEARARPSITTPLQQRVADLVVAKFDALTDNERAAYPLAIRRLLARDGELRTALDEFRAQPFRKRTRGRIESVSLRPLRCWGALHEHAYAFCGALTKMTSVDREWAFRCERGARACATMTAARPRPDRGYGCGEMAAWSCDVAHGRSKACERARTCVHHSHVARCDVTCGSDAMRASVLKCYILRGNYHASLQGLLIELSLASGASRVTELTAELLRDVAELQRRLEGWRPEQSGKACHLFYAAHAKALARLTFKKLTDATTGTAAVPAILKEVFDKHGGEVVKLKVMKLATLVRWRGGVIEGPPRQEIHRPGDGGELYGQ